MRYKPYLYEFDVTIMSFFLFFCITAIGSCQNIDSSQKNAAVGYKALNVNSYLVAIPFYSQ